MKLCFLGYKYLSLFSVAQMLINICLIFFFFNTCKHPLFLLYCYKSLSHFIFIFYVCNWFGFVYHFLQLMVWWRRELKMQCPLPRAWGAWSRALGLTFITLSFSLYNTLFPHDINYHFGLWESEIFWLFEWFSIWFLITLVSILS